MRIAIAVTVLGALASGAGVAAAAPRVGATAAYPTPFAAMAQSVHAGRALASAPAYPLPAPRAQPEPCPLPPAGPVPPPPTPQPKVATEDLPPEVVVPPHRVDPGPVTGKGMWWTTWARSRVDVADVVARARTAGLRQIWVRTGGTRQGWYGAPLLSRLLPAAHAVGLKVVAWDFPTLSDPLADIDRARAAVTGTFSGQRIDAFSPDIETAYEGTFSSEPRVRLYLSGVRAAAGDLPLIATVMRPTPHQLEHYPYRAEAPYVDAFAPMVYWSCDEPGDDTAAAVRTLAELRPVHPIGQAYDMADEGGRRGMPTGPEIWRFLDVAKRSGAVGASLYDAEEAGAPQWSALGGYPW